MEAGRNPSPILKALKWIKSKTDVDVRVVIYKPKLRWFSRDLMERALRTFDELELYRSPKRNSVLFFFNQTHQEFVIIGDEGFHRVIKQASMDQLAQYLKEDLRSTEFENAVSMNLYALGQLLFQHKV